MRQALLETRINKLRTHADRIASVLADVSARVPGTPPANLDDLHREIKRGELRRVLVSCQAISDEAATALPGADPATREERIARRAKKKAARTGKKTKKKATKKKTGG